MTHWRTAYRFLLAIFSIVASLHLPSCSEQKVGDFSGVTISSEEDLIKFAEAINGGEYRKANGRQSYISIRLDSDIQLTKPWTTPIGTQENPFCGVLDGAGHTIYNLKIDSPDSSRVALFGYMKGSFVRAVTLENVEINGNINVAALCGYAYDTDFHNCKVSGVINGNACVGSVVAEVSYCTIGDCEFNGTVNACGYSVGGIVGAYEYGTMIRCQSAGTITGSGDVSGLVGTNSSCSVVDSNSIAQVKHLKSKTLKESAKLTRLLFHSL